MTGDVITPANVLMLLVLLGQLLQWAGKRQAVEVGMAERVQKLEDDVPADYVRKDVLAVELRAIREAIEMQARAQAAQARAQEDVTARLSRIEALVKSNGYNQPPGSRG